MASKEEDGVASIVTNIQSRMRPDSLVESRQGNYSLLCLSERNCIRRAAIFVVESPFDIFILATIIANCVVLALDAPLPNNDKSAISDELEKSELFFLVIFTIEAILKVIALGFVLHPGSYLRNGWNILDFIVVITGYISLRQFGNDSFGDVKPLRAIRVLRPLKLVSGTPSLQVVMKSIMRAMVPLLQVLVLTLFVIVIYATVGLSFLVNKFHATCFKNNTDDIIPLGETFQPCDYESKGMFRGRQCNISNNEVCREYWIGPNNGISTFDNIVLAILTVSQCITMEGWTDVMYSTFYAADSDSYFYTLYYVSLILIGSFFMLNLVLGVLSGEFAKERERVETRRNFLKLRREQKVDREVEQYLEWISRAEEIIVEDLVSQQENETDSNQNKPIPTDFVFNPISILAVDGGRIPRLNLAERHKRFPKFRLKERLMRIRVRHLVKHEGFFWAVVIIVLLNTVSLATEHYDQPQWLTVFQDKAEIVFLSIFVIEMLLKIYGLGPSTYFRSTFNAFDFVVIIFGLFELIIQKPLGISVLRCLRLLRIFKMTSYWSSLRNLVRSLTSSMKSILSLMFLLFLFVVIFALLGMQFFGGRFVSDTEPPRTNFDDFPNAMLAVFQILTGEDWNSVMYNGIDAYGGARDAKGLAFGLYFVLLVIIGNYTLLNVFLAIAVDNLANAHVLTEDEERERLEREARNQPVGSERRPSSHWQEVGNLTKTLALVKNWKNSATTSETNGDAEGENGVDGSSTKSSNGTKKALTKSLMKNINRYRKAIGDDHDVEAQQPDPHQSHREGGARRRSEVQAVTRALKGRKSKVRKLKKSAPIIRTKSLFLFGPENRFRRVCHYIVNLRHFDNFMLVIIIFSSILLAVEDPVDDYSHRNKVIRYFDYIFTTIFTFEVFVKLIDFGAVLHPGSYFRSKWNFIDALVVCCNIASLVISQTQSNVSVQSLLKVLRVLRVFRPLKMMNKLKKLEAVFRCMWYSFKNVANILLITVLFLFIFSVIGVQLFQGKFFHCTDPSKMFESVCKGRYFEFSQGTDSIENVDVKVKERRWLLRDFHFNNVFNAMLTLYTSATGEGWPNAMQHTMDVTAVNQGPIRNYSVENALFYISFVVVFSFFFLNIFVALVILTFQEQGEKELVNSELDRNQRDCISFVIRAKPQQTFMPANKNTWSYKVWLVVVSKPFELFIMALIILNTIVLMMEYYDQPTDYKNMCNYFNAALTFLFTMEAALKLFAFKLSYFRDSWNVFDFIVVVGSLLDTSLTFGNTYDLPFDPSMFRIFRAARLIKILKQGAGIRVLLWTFLQSFKALPYVTLLIFLVFFIYAVIGMQIFGKIKLDDSSQINKYNNFQNIVKSLLLLFRSSTGENWQEIMLSCYDGALCDERANPQSATCGSTAWAITFFCTFIFLCMFFMLNLFVAVIMDNFEYLTRDQSILGPHHLDEFVQIWSVYDPNATGEIHYSKVYEMMIRLSPPVGFGKKCPKIVAYKRLIKMNMPLNEDETIHFTTTLFALVRTSLQIRVTGNMNANDTMLRKMITQDWANILPRVLDKMIPKHSVLGCHQMTVGKIYCAKLMCENYRQNKRRKQFEILEDDEFRTQRPDSIFRRLVGSVTRSMRQRRASSTNGLVPSEETSSQNGIDRTHRRNQSESLTMEDLKRSSSCHNFSSEKAKRRQELNPSPLIKHAVRQTLSSSPPTSHRKLKSSSSLGFPETKFHSNEHKDERFNHDSSEYQVNSPDSSKQREEKIQINAGSVPRNTFSRPKLKQTPSIVINSPVSNERRAVNLTDVTLEEPNLGRFKETDRGEFSHFNKPRTLQQQNKEQFMLDNGREAYIKVPHEKPRENEYQLYTENERDKQDRNRKVLSPNEVHLTDNSRDLPRHGARNADSGARNVHPRARNLSPGARNIDQSSSDEEKRDKTISDKLRTSPNIFPEGIDNPGNTEVFQRHEPIYVGQDVSDGSRNSLYKQKNVSNSVSTEKPRQMARQSQSESNLKAKTERATYPIVKTWSVPTSIQARQSYNEHGHSSSTDSFTSASSLLTNNSLERDIPNHKPRASNPPDLSRRRANSEINREVDHTKDTADKSRTTSINTEDPSEPERPQGEAFGGLLGEADASHSAEYYDQMISKINEQINLVVSRNKSPYALYGLGSDDDDDWC